MFNVIILDYCARNNVMYVHARFSSQTRIEFRMKYIKAHSQKVFYVDTVEFSPFYAVEARLRLWFETKGCEYEEAQKGRKVTERRKLIDSRSISCFDIPQSKQSIRVFVLNSRDVQIDVLREKIWKFYKIIILCNFFYFLNIVSSVYPTH